MPHTPTPAKQSVVLDSFLGLVTNAPPESLPEGASPWTQDTDFTIGDVFQRPGLVSAYSPIGVDALLQEDGVSFFELETDPNSIILLEV